MRTRLFRCECVHCGAMFTDVQGFLCDDCYSLQNSDSMPVAEARRMEEQEHNAWENWYSLLETEPLNES